MRINTFLPMPKRLRVIDDQSNLIESFRVAVKNDRMLLTRNNCGSKTRTSKLADASSCKLWETFPESEEREQKSPRTSGRRKAMEPICSTPFFLLSLPPSFSSLLNPPTKPLLLVSDFYLVAPGFSIYLSVSSLILSRSFFLPLLFISFSFFHPLSRYRLPTARSLEQSGTSYSGFQTRRQGSHSFSPLLSSSSSSSTPFSATASPFGSTTWSFLSEIA